MKNSIIKSKIKITFIAGLSAVVVGVGVACAGFALSHGTQASPDVSGNTTDYAQESMPEVYDAAKPLSTEVQSVEAKILVQMYDVSGIIDEALKSVVAVNCIQYQKVNTGFGFFFGQQETREVASCGTGIIIGKQEDRLLVLTNNHVVEDAGSISVTFVDEEKVAAEVIGTAPNSDIALVSVNIEDVKKETLNAISIAVMGDSDALKVGNATIAIGNALGYGQSVTTGIVSALKREVKLVDMTLELLQTDAAINAGNSGGPLLNTNGEVIGINSAKYSADGVEGMGYAIPINTAKPIIEELLNPSEKPENPEERAYLGIYGITITAQYQFMYGMPAGVYVNEVAKDSPAEKAQLSEGDIITAVDNKKVTSMEDLSEILAVYKPGDTVSLTVKIANKNSYRTTVIQVQLGSIATE